MSQGDVPPGQDRVHLSMYREDIDRLNQLKELWRSQGKRGRQLAATQIFREALKAYHESVFGGGDADRG